MKIENNIKWCDDTGNVDVGCTPVSPGCKNCWAKNAPPARVLRAKGIETWGEKGTRMPVESMFKKLPQLNKLCVCEQCHESSPFYFLPTKDRTMNERTDCACGAKLRRIRMFAFDSTDWLDAKRPVERLARALDAIRLAPNVDVLLLTKRIENFPQRLADSALEYVKRHTDIEGRTFSNWVYDWCHGKPPSHVWLGVSVEDQKRADERIPMLLQAPAAVRFLSVEPLLEPVNLRRWFAHSIRCEKLPGPGMNGGETCRCVFPDWAIVGGESGPDRRDCGVEAIESVVAQCVAAGVLVYCKQDSALRPGQRGRLSDKAWSRKEFPR